MELSREVGGADGSRALRCRRRWTQGERRFVPKLTGRTPHNRLRTLTEGTRYKTENGARVGDFFMSLIHTCRLNEVNPFDYLSALQRHAAAVLVNPGLWLPWNYSQAIAAAPA